MAVEKAKVIARLKAMFPKANLSQKRMDAIADKLAKKPADDADDAAIDAVIKDFDDMMSITDLAKDDDRLRSLEEAKNKAEKDAEEAKKKKAEGASGGKADEEDEIDEKDLTPGIKALLKSVKSLTEEVATIKNGSVTATKTEQAKAALEKSEVLKAMKPEIKDRWLKRVDINSETSFEDQVKELESEFTELYQVSADQNQYSGAAGSGGTATTADQKDVDAIVDNFI